MRSRWLQGLMVAGIPAVLGVAGCDCSDETDDDGVSSSSSSSGASTSSSSSTSSGSSTSSTSGPGGGGTGPGGGGSGPGGTGGVGGVGGVGGDGGSVGGAGGVGGDGGAPGGAGGVGGMGMGGAGGGPVAGDQCPGISVPIALGATVNLTGTTVGATNDYTSLVCDAPASTGPDIVYALVLAAAGTFEFTLDNTSTWNASAYLRNPTCADQTSGKFCYDQDPLQELDLRHLEAGTYYLVIDGANDSSGPFTLSASLSAPVCGDGAVNPGEQCDDGNAVAMDGCTNCNPDAVPPATNICPGSPFTISTGMTLAISGDNCGATDDYKSLGTQCQPEVGGRDQVYQITPLQSGNLTAVVGTLSDKVTSICATNGMSAECWDHALYLRSACDATVDDTLDCTDAPDIETIGPVPVVANVPYWLVIDGYDAEFYSCGPYTIYVDLQ